MMRKHVVLAVFKRNVGSYFSGVLGYLFIVVFVVAGAFAAFNPQFFTNNLANLEQLTEFFPLLLLFLIPAITMGAWADERKVGTDELLFTLPAKDTEILLGKYFAVLAVYSVALAFSLTYLLVLGYYADPDWGLLLTTFFGYWLAGAALLSAGMFASALTNSATVAFVLGAAICAVPVFIGKIAPASDFFQQLSLPEHLREFGFGLVPFSSVLYFVSLTVFMLYLNQVVIGKRHWSSGREGAAMGPQFAVRALSLAAILISFNVVLGKASEVFHLRFDMTEEKIYTLSGTTTALVDKIDKERPVTIQAFISPDVPREIVPQRNRLRGLLRQYDRLGGSRIEVRYVDVEPFSEEAEEARLFGIEPVPIRTDRAGRIGQEDVFLGVVVSSPYDEVIVPFFDVGMPIEYELTRSIRTVSNAERLTVGILNTDAQVNGGFNMQSFRTNPEWQIKQELEKQYNVEEVAPDAPIDEDKYDVLIAVLPSSLTEPQMANFVDYVKKGKPVLIFDDPLPVYSGGIQNAPRSPKPRRGGGMFGGGPPPEQKADGGRATSLVNELGIEWIYDQIVWQDFNPHPEFVDLPPELVFVSPKSGIRTAFNPSSPVTSGLQELLAFFPGSIRPRPNSALEFEPLLRTSQLSGIHSWNDIIEPGFLGSMQIVENPVRIPDSDAHVLAAHIRSKTQSEGKGVNVIYVADADICSDALFNIVKGELYGLRLDNVNFVLNCVDVLAGDESYIALRKRSPHHRILTVVQNQANAFREERREEEQKAEREAERQLEQARERFRKQRELIEADEKLSAGEKSQKIRIAQENEQRRIEVAEANIEREKQAKIEQIKAREQRQIRELENTIRMWVVLLPPIPAILLGIAVMGTRLYTERRDISASRLVHK